MRSLKIKTICTPNRVNSSLANPKAEIGNYNDSALQIRQINNIPDDVNNYQVLRLFKFSVCISKRMEFNFSELGEGKIIR